METRAVDLWRYLECCPMPMAQFGEVLNAECRGTLQDPPKRPVLVAYSMGARLALHALLEPGNPWQAAILVGPHPGLESEAERAARREQDAIWGSRALSGDWDAFLADWNSLAVLEGPEDSRPPVAPYLRRKEVARSFVDWSLGAQDPLWELLPSIRVPVLWVCGERDEKFRALADRALALLPKGELAVVEGSGHRVPWEKPVEFAGLTGGWLGKLPPPVRAVFFDLDQCLSPAEGVGEGLYEPAMAAIREANRGTLTGEALEAALADLWKRPYDDVALHHGFSPPMAEAGRAVFGQLEFTGSMEGYPDLAVLEDLPVRRFLVTSGFRRLQESKIRALRLEGRFEEIRIDALDDPVRKGKRGIFAELLEAHGLEPGEVRVVGDNPDSEIAAGNSLGIPTVQILRPGVKRGTTATHVIEGLEELKRLL